MNLLLEVELSHLELPVFPFAQFSQKIELFPFSRVLLGVILEEADRWCLLDSLGFAAERGGLFLEPKLWDF